MDQRYETRQTLNKFSQGKSSRNKEKKERKKTKSQWHLFSLERKSTAKEIGH